MLSTEPAFHRELTDRKIGPTLKGIVAGADSQREPSSGGFLYASP